MKTPRQVSVASVSLPFFDRALRVLRSWVATAAARCDAPPSSIGELCGLGERIHQSMAIVVRRFEHYSV